jgi:hypothetical protein
MLIPILALSIPVIALIFRGLKDLARLRLEEARARAGGLTPNNSPYHRSRRRSSVMCAT